MKITRSQINKMFDVMIQSLRLPAGEDPGYHLDYNPSYGGYRIECSEIHRNRIQFTQTRLPALAMYHVIRAAIETLNYCNNNNN